MGESDSQNRRTIFRLVKEAVFRRGLERPRNPEGEVDYDEAAARESRMSA